MNTALWIFGALGGTGLIGFLLGKVSDETINKWLGKPCFVVGAAFTHFMNKITGGMWNKTIEPFFKKIVNALVLNFFEGMDSDNNPNSKYGS